MSQSTKSNKPFSLSRLEDATLGAFALVPSSQTLDHLVRYLSTWSGSDKLFMIIQYTLKLVVPYLHMRARIQHRVGRRSVPTSSAAEGLAKLGSLIGDARMLSNFWGLLPIIRWLTSLERNPPPTRRLHTIERLQGWSMLLYYPLEHVYYLLTHSIIPQKLPLPSPFNGSVSKPSGSFIDLDAGVISRLSTRFWGVYVLLQFAHLREDRRLLMLKERTIAKSKAISVLAETEELKNRRDALWNELIVSLGYLPLTIHWSLEQGLFRNEAWVGVFGLIAAIAGWRSGWKATAQPSTPKEAPPVPEDPESAPLEPKSTVMDPDIPVGLDAGLDEI